MKAPKVTRRAVLRNAGVFIALPFLESFTGRGAWAQSVSNAPNFIVLYKPNGYLKGETDMSGGKLPAVFQPFAPHADVMSIVRGMDSAPGNKQIFTMGHDVGCVSLLTGGLFTGERNALRAQTATPDQIIAQKFGQRPLYMMGRKPHPNVNFAQLSWSSVGPDTPIRDAATVFKQLMLDKGSSNQQEPVEEEITNKGKSVLDFVLNETKRLRANVGKDDQQKLDQYLTGIESLEKDLFREPATQDPDVMPPSCPGFPPVANQSDYVKNLQLLLDLTVKGLQCGRRKVVTFIFEPESTGQRLPVTGDMPHHTASHQNHNLFRAGNVWYSQQIAEFINRLKKTQGPTGQRLIDESIVYVAAPFGDSHGHHTEDLTSVIFGKGMGRLKPRGTNYLQAKGVPHANLLLKLLHVMGDNRTKFGKSTGVLNGI